MLKRSSGLDWIDGNFGAFSSESLVQPSFESLDFFLVGEKPKLTSNLAKMAFIGRETVRKQHRHNSL